MELLFAIIFFVNHRASGVADFHSPDDPMLTFSKPLRFGGLAQGRAREDRAGVVAARADDGVVKLGWPKAGHGALYPRDPSGEPDDSPTGKEVAKIETMSIKHGKKNRMRNQYCHFSRTDPAMGLIVKREESFIFW